MANESIVYGIVVTNPAAGEVNVAVATTGITLTGSNTIELRILKASLAEADNAGFNTKENVLHAIESIKAQVVKTDWPPGGLV
jgi:NADPH-dependent 7-cyano-7-deazaguanine reductase QueF-like protein